MRYSAVLFVSLFLTFVAFPAQAASTCYTQDEAEAEQGIRIHSELMVIGLNCQGMSQEKGKKNLYAVYREFTLKHANVLAAYEITLMGYFRHQGSANPEKSLHTLRTQLANNVSDDAAKMRPDLFCLRYAPRLEQVKNMDDKTFRRWAGTFFPGHPASHPMCGKY